MVRIHLHPPRKEVKMRYWQHGETGRLIKVDVPMAPSNWIELTEEQYNEAVEVSEKEKESEST